MKKENKEIPKLFNCRGCRFNMTERVASDDSYDVCHKWSCTFPFHPEVVKDPRLGKNIVKEIGYDDANRTPETPEWCKLFEQQKIITDGIFSMFPGDKQEIPGLGGIESPQVQAMVKSGMEMWLNDQLKQDDSTDLDQELMDVIDDFAGMANNATEEYKEAAAYAKQDILKAFHPLPDKMKREVIRLMKSGESIKERFTDDMDFRERLDMVADAILGKVKPGHFLPGLREEEPKEAQSVDEIVDAYVEIHGEEHREIIRKAVELTDFAANEGAHVLLSLNVEMGPPEMLGEMKRTKVASINMHNFDNKTHVIQTIHRLARIALKIPSTGGTDDHFTMMIGDSHQFATFTDPNLRDLESASSTLIRLNQVANSIVDMHGDEMMKSVRESIEEYAPGMEFAEKVAELDRLVGEAKKQVADGSTIVVKEYMNTSENIPMFKTDDEDPS